MIKRRYHVGYCCTTSVVVGTVDTTTEALVDYDAVLALQETLRQELSRPDLIVLGFSRYDEN